MEMKPMLTLAGYVYSDAAAMHTAWLFSPTMHRYTQDAGHAIITCFEEDAIKKNGLHVDFCL